MFFKRLQEDIDTFIARDPAAHSRLDVILLYPGIHAIWFYRVAHWLWTRHFRMLARFLSQNVKFLTGVEIHPGAVIGRRFVIDHGTGVVIGESAVIGDDVTLYQSVTLGGISPAEDSRAQVNVKRHPTLEDNVIVGSGAQVLGDIIIGEGARIGANAVVTTSVPAGVTAVGIPARVIMPRDKEKAKEFCAYGTPSDGLPDPVQQTIEALRAQVETLMNRVEELEGQRASGRGAKSTKKDANNNVKKAKTVVAGGKS